MNLKSIILGISLVAMMGTDMLAQKSFYDYTVKTLEGKAFPLSQLKGKKVMVVNTASKCGLTPQYKRLESIYKKYGGEHFEIIAFPANNFLSQEPGNAQEIRTFCSTNYDVTFPIMEKISVKGDDMAPIYKWLTSKELNGFKNSSVKWNFQKYLIDEEGHLVRVVSPLKKPDSKSIIQWITGEKE